MFNGLHSVFSYIYSAQLALIFFCEQIVVLSWRFSSSALLWVNIGCYWSNSSCFGSASGSNWYWAWKSVTLSTVLINVWGKKSYFLASTVPENNSISSQWIILWHDFWMCIERVPPIQEGKTNSSLFTDCVLIEGANNRKVSKSCCVVGWTINQVKNPELSFYELLKWKTEPLTRRKWITLQGSVQCRGRDRPELSCIGQTGAL